MQDPGTFHLADICSDCLGRRRDSGVGVLRKAADIEARPRHILHSVQPDLGAAVRLEHARMDFWYRPNGTLQRTVFTAGNTMPAMTYS